MPMERWWVAKSCPCSPHCYYRAGRFEVNLSKWTAYLKMVKIHTFLVLWLSCWKKGLWMTSFFMHHICSSGHFCFPSLQAWERKRPTGGSVFAFFLTLQCNRSLPWAAWESSAALVRSHGLSKSCSAHAVLRQQFSLQEAQWEPLGKVRGPTSCFLSASGHQRVYLRGSCTPLPLFPFVMGASRP